MNIREVLGSSKFMWRWASLFVVFFLPMSLAGAGCDTPNQIQVPQQTAAQQMEQIEVVDSEAIQPTPTTDGTSENAVVAPPVQQEIAPQPTLKPAAAPSTAPNGTYTNVYGNEVPSPYVAPSKPAGASAQCRDGTYSFSQSRRGTCSHHGGVAEWY